MRRRDFLLRSTKAVTVLGLGNAVTTYSANAFHWPRPDETKLRFAVVSDGHYGQPGTEFDRFHEEMTGWLNAEHKHNPLAFAMFNGDIIHDDPAFLPLVKKHLAKLQMPVYASRGNHDQCSPSEWERTWNHDLNYSFRRDQTGFIVLDTSDGKGSLLCPDIDRVRRELKRFSSADAVFVFMHVPPHKWTRNGVDCDTLIEQFSRQSNLKAIFHGHDHDLDGAKILGAKHYFFDGHLGGNWGVNYRGYRVVEVLRNNSVVTWQMNPEQRQQVNSTDVP